MLWRKCTWCSNWKNRLLAWPLVHARNRHHPQIDESDWHLSPWLLSEVFLKWALWKYCILYKPKDLHYSEWSTRSCIDEPHCNIQFLTMVTQMEHLFFFFHIMQNKFSLRHIPGIMHRPWQSLQFCTDFNHLRVVLIIYYKHIHLIFQFNSGAIRLFLRTFFLSRPFNILREMPVASSSIDVW